VHPAYSIIFFTTSSGAGYGLLFVTSLLAAFGLLPPDRWLGLACLGLAFLLVSAGLFASLLHLGRPERAWRALSQWRSSWLSREGVLAIATYVPFAALALGWVLLERVWAWAGLLAAVLAGCTVYATAMIYASLKPVRAWHNPWVPPGYLALALATGSVLCLLVTTSFGVAPSGLFALAVVALVLAWAIKLVYWRTIRDEPPSGSLVAALGLADYRSARLFERPHTQENYLEREMGFRVARKHAEKLRRLALLLGLAVPGAVILIAGFLPSGALRPLLLVIATAALAAAVLVERWLFFSEAKHTQSLYYGAS